MTKIQLIVAGLFLSQCFTIIGLAFALRAVKSLREAVGTLYEGLIAQNTYIAKRDALASRKEQA